jgi:hypothetical protein
MVLAEKCVERIAVRQVPQHEFAPQHRIAMACREIVESDDIASPAQQMLDHVRADIPRPADDEQAERGGCGGVGGRGGGHGWVL